MITYFILFYAEKNTTDKICLSSPLQTFSSDGTQVNISPQTIFRVFPALFRQSKRWFSRTFIKAWNGLHLSKQCMKNDKKQKEKEKTDRGSKLGFHCPFQFLLFAEILFTGTTF